MAGEQVGAATDDSTLEQIQPSRWSPTAWSCGTLLQKVNRRLAGGFTSAELVEDAAEAAICALGAGIAGRSAQGSTREPFARLLLSAFVPA